MMNAAVFRVVDSNGLEHGTKMTSEQAFAMMEFLLVARPNVQVRSERIDPPPPATVNPVALPVIAETYPVIATGQEREALRQAIDDRLDATARLANADDAVDRARVFLDARQAELDALSESLDREIAASGATLAALLKAGAATTDTNRLIDRSAVLDATTRRDTAKAAFDQLEGELTNAQKAHASAETCQRLAVHAVKTADRDAMVERLERVRIEFFSLLAEVDAARFAQVPMTIRAEHAARIDLNAMPGVDEPAGRWHKYTAALMEDADAIFPHAEKQS
jgi:hypothetical protein